MIAKNKQLNISVLKKSSLQTSLQSCQLNTYSLHLAPLAFSLQKPKLLQTVCKEKTINNQVVDKILFAGSFAKNSNQK
jgi:hypothetical protein